ncbi:MAG TPA: glycosyltransferase family 4 protein [Actinomycetota bacterium]|nr:glycosyltransferase family 4 protein [Actinomycetota bacterium]
MRIVQLTRDFPPAASGIGDHVARTSAALAGGGDEVAVVCSAPADPWPGIDVRPVIEHWDAAGVAAIVAAVREARPDAIVWHYNPFQIGRRGLAPWAGKLAAALSRVAPLTVVAHELWYPWGRSGLRGLIWAAGQRRQFRGVAAAARALVATTEARRAHLAKRYPATPVSVVAAGATVDPHPDAPGREAFRSSLGIPGSAFVVAHLGAIGEGRDLRPALAAIRRLRRDGTDARLLLAGRTGVAPPAGDGIHVTGPRNHALLSAALGSADCYLFAEPTGPVARKTSLLSALAHGLAVVSYTGAAAEAFFRDGETVLLVEPSEERVAGALSRLIADPSLRRRLGDAGAALHAQRFSWAAIAEGIRSAASTDVTHEPHAT